MLRLTVRSGRDGRLLARVVDRDGVMFVLDYGDRSILSDASRKVLHGGFNVSWQGGVETAVPGNAALLRQLALFYAQQGLLVCVDEPDWPRKTRKAEPARPSWQDGPPTILQDEPLDFDPNTRLMSRRDLVALRDKLDRLDARRKGRATAFGERPKAQRPTLAPDLTGDLGGDLGATLDDVDLEDIDLETDEVVRKRPRTRAKPWAPSE